MSNANKRCSACGASCFCLANPEAISRMVAATREDTLACIKLFRANKVPKEVMLKYLECIAALLAHFEHHLNKDSPFN